MSNPNDVGIDPAMVGANETIWTRTWFENGVLKRAIIDPREVYRTSTDTLTATQSADGVFRVQS